MKKKIILFFICLAFLNSCAQSTAFVSPSMTGPAMTAVATGNYYKAGLSYAFNQQVEKSTGKPVIVHVTKALKPPKKKSKIGEDLIALIETQIKNTRKKLLTKIN